MTDWTFNEHGYWCECCGHMIAPADADEASLPEDCSQCGFPDPERVAAYHFADDEDAFDKRDICNICGGSYEQHELCDGVCLDCEEEVF